MRETKAPAPKKSYLERYSRDFINLSVELYCISNPEGYFLDLNEYWTQVLGWSLEELKARPSIEFVHSDDVASTLKNANKLYSGEAFVNFRNRYRHKDGSYRWIDWRSQLSEDGKVLIATAADITQDLEIQKLISNSQEGARIGHWQVDLASNEAIWSDMTYQIHEISSSQTILVDEAINYYIEEHRPIIRKHVENAIRHRTHFDDELQIVTAAGNKLWVRPTGYAVVEDGKVVRIEGVFQDINERKIQSIELQEKNEELKRYQMALDRSSLIVRTNFDGVIVHVNENYCEASGWKSAELVGSRINFSSTEINSKDFFKKVTECLLLQNTWRGEVCLPIKGRGCIWADTSVTPVLGIDHKIKEFIFISNDITQRKIAEKKIQEDREKSVQANLAKSQFLATISHEIRTPMNGIIGMTQLLEDEVESSTAREYLSIIQQSGETLTALIDDLLEYTKIDAGILRLSQKLFDLKPFLKKTFQLLEPRGTAKGLEMKLVFDPHLPEQVYSDRTRLDQIVSNLLSNAIKFTSKGSIVMEVRMGKNNRLAISVSDSGIGIQKEKQEIIFEAFKQIDGKRFQGGSGLGLSISKSIAHLMGGEISLQSTPGKGSVFTLSLPIVDSKAKLTKGSLKAKTPDSSGMSAMKVLVAEDNKINQALMIAILKKLGVKGRLADHGEIAVEMLQRERFDVVLMDLNMPKMDGIEATRVIRKLDIDQPRIIALTAFATQEDRERCLNAGMDAFLTKPIKISTLQHEISNRTKAP